MFDYFTSWKTSVVLAFAFSCLAVLNLSDGAGDPLVSGLYLLMAATCTVAAVHEFRRDEQPGA